MIVEPATALSGGARLLTPKAYDSPAYAEGVQLDSPGQRPSLLYTSQTPAGLPRR